MDATERRHLTLSIILPKCSNGEMLGLIRVASAKQERFPYFCAWLLNGPLAGEMQRRETPGREPEMVELPTLTGNSAADFLIGASVFCRLPFSDAQCAFLDDVAMKVSASIAGYLEHCHGEDVI